MNQNPSSSSKKNGFTLIELLVVATIIIVLTTIGIASFSTANKSARDAKRKSDLETIRQAMVLYRTQNGGYPTAAGGATAAQVKSLLEAGYISPPMPVDPATGASYQNGRSYANSYAFCAAMETGKGNKNSLGLVNADWVNGTGSFYCISHL